MKRIENLLLREPSGVLSLTGGGGKTSLMFYLARQLSRAGRRVLTTTTTKLFLPTAEQSKTLLVDPDPFKILHQISPMTRSYGHITAAVALIAEGTKLKGFSAEEISIFAASGLFDWILVEADGSARRPLKAPAEHEPVIPAATTVLVAVAGLEVLGRPLSEDLVFRAELAGPLMGLAAGKIITAAALAKLFSHPQGAFKDAPQQARRHIYLNKADDAARRAGAAEIAELLRQGPIPIAETLIVGQALDGVRVLAEHPLTSCA
jgi:probable selenium-dependent hydroxylase accessory protein YqeC